MSKPIKILCAIALAVFLLGAGGVATIVYFVRSHSQGVGLANDAYEALIQKNYDLAIARYDAALKKPLGSFHRSYACLNRAVAFNCKQQFDQAVRDYSEALRLNPNLAPAFEGRGWTYQQQGQTDKALADFSEAIRRDSNAKSAYYNRGVVLYNRKEISRALPDFDEAVRCMPNNANAFYMRGLCYAAKNDLDPALANFDAAIAIDPANSLAFIERGHLYERKGERAKSIHDLAEGARLSPPMLSTAPANYRDRLHPNPLDLKTELNVEPLPAADATRSGSEKTYALIVQEAGRAYDMGDFDRAISLYNEASSLNISKPEASRILMRRGNSHFEKGEDQQAARDYDEAIQLDPKNAAAYVNRGSILDRKGDHEAALQDYKEALRIDPNDAFAYLNRAGSYVETGAFDQALTDYDKTTELAPLLVGSYLGRAMVYLRQRDLRKAIDESTKALQVDPNTARACVYRAIAYAQSKQYERADHDLEAASKMITQDGGDSLNSIAWLRATSSEPRLRDGTKAIEQSMKACELSQWKNWGFIDTLAAAYAESRNFDQAIKYQKQVIEMMGADSSRRAECERRLKLYEQHKPYRESPKG